MLAVKSNNGRRTGSPAFPFPLNSKTFWRNIIPNSYPLGAHAGMDWMTTGGCFDNTDQRNPVYWGPPRIVPGHPKCGQLPGERPENFIRFLKIEGYIGLYSARQRPDGQQAAPNPGEDDDEQANREYIAGVDSQQAPLTGLAAIAAMAEQTRMRRHAYYGAGAAAERAHQEGRRATRAEESQDRRAAPAPEPAAVPAMVGVGNGSVGWTPDEEILSEVDLPLALGMTFADTAIETADGQNDEEEETPAPVDPDEPVGGRAQAAQQPPQQICRHQRNLMIPAGSNRTIKTFIR